MNSGKIRWKPLSEVSGKVTLDAVRQIADLKPHRLSVGALTYSAKALVLEVEVAGPQKISLRLIKGRLGHNPNPDLNIIR